LAVVALLDEHHVDPLERKVSERADTVDTAPNHEDLGAGALAE
jgi:hypothetical protein